MMGGKRTIIQVMEDPEEGKDQKMPPPLPPLHKELTLWTSRIKPSEINFRNLPSPSSTVRHIPSVAKSVQSYITPLRLRS